jgi:hypothetical protein
VPLMWRVARAVCTFRHNQLSICSCAVCVCRDIHREGKICALGSEVVKSWFNVSQGGGWGWGDCQTAEHGTSPWAPARGGGGGVLGHSVWAL